MNNVLQSIDDKSVFIKIEEDEFYRPIRYKKLHDRHIYYSRSPPVSTGLPILCDFGGARLDSTNQEGNIMFSAYKPPEVILGMKWDHKVDIWGLGLMVRRHALLSDYPFSFLCLIRDRYGACLRAYIYSRPASPGLWMKSSILLKWCRSWGLHQRNFDP